MSPSRPWVLDWGYAEYGLPGIEALKLSEKGCEQRSNREIDRYKEHEKGLLGAP